MKYEPPFDAVNNPDASYINGDPSIGRRGSVPPAECFENHQREITHLISNSLQTPADDDLHQLARGIANGALNFCIDSGPANALQIASVSPPLDSFTAGLEFRVLIAQTNTGPTTITVGNIGPAKVLHRNGSELNANDLLHGQIATLVCDGTNFQLQNSGVADGSGSGPSNRYEVYLPYVRDTGTANHVIGLYTPAIPDIAEHRTVLVKLKFATTGPTDFTPNNFPTKPVTHPDGSPIKAGDGVINQIWLLCFDGVQWQLLSNFIAPAHPPGPMGSFKSLQFMDPATGAISTYPSESCPYLYRVPRASGNRSVWTWSAFIKYPVPQHKPYYYPGWYNDQSESLMAAGNAGSGGDLTGAYLIGGDQDQCINLYWNDSAHPKSGCSDPSAAPIHQGVFTWGVLKDTKWHHVLLKADGANIYFYIDGILVSQGAISGAGAVNSTEMQVIGSAANALWYCARCRMAEINFIDGQAFDWMTFANNIAGQFVPKIYTGSYGTQGYYLNWKNSTAVTSTTLGADQSGNKNNFTPVNFELTQVTTDFPGNPTS